MNFIIPIGLLVAIGLIFGIILTVASKLMYVPVDELVTQVRYALPGANCGACGYAGCDDYAAAVGEKREPNVSKCTVGGPDVAARIAEILGVEATVGAAPVAVVLCQGDKTAAKNLMEYGSDMTCKGAASLFGGSKACTFGCLGLGDCVTACEFDAIEIVNGLATVCRENCVGCGACAEACPKSVIKMLTKDDRVNVRCQSMDKARDVMKACKVGCIGCKKCENECKFDAIHVVDGLSKIDYEKCVNCGMCVKVCPTHAIEIIPKTKKVVIKSPQDVKTA